MFVTSSNMQTVLEHQSGPGKGGGLQAGQLSGPFSWTGTPVRRGADSMNIYAHRGFLVGPASGRWVGLVSGLVELRIS